MTNLFDPYFSYSLYMEDYFRDVKQEKEYLEQMENDFINPEFLTV